MEEEKQKLSKFERQSLLNQMRILERIEDKNYDKAKTIITQGLTNEYNFVFEELSEEIPQDVLNEVLEILRMYEALLTYAQNNSDFDENRLVFEGFDNQDELEHYKYLRYLIEVEKAYPAVQKSLPKHGYASMPKLHIYRKMLEAWKNADSPLSQQLSAETIEEILRNK